MTENYQQSGKCQKAVIIIKAAPQVGEKHGETVCCAGLDEYGNWLRLYPVSFRTLDDEQKFSRWDRIEFDWRRPRDDRRLESRRVYQQSLRIIGKLKSSERERFLTPAIVTSLKKERERGRSLALIRPTIEGFDYERKTDSEIQSEKAKFNAIRSQKDLFASNTVPREPCPYRFKYRYTIEDGQRVGTCQDWETEATFLNFRRAVGETKALQDMQSIFGERYPKAGMVLAMGTHSQYPETWLINGVVRLNEDRQGFLFSAD